MPRVSLVGNGHGGSEDYATISLWAAAEFSVDYGSRLEAQCLGDCGSSQTVSGTTVNGLVPLVYTLGVVYDFTAATQSQLATIRTFNHRTPLEIKNFSFTAVSDFFNCYVPNGSSDGSTLENIFSEHPTASGVDCFSISGNVPNSTCTGLVTDGGVRGIDYGFNFVFNVTNFVVLNAQDDGIEGSGSNGTVTDGYSGDNTNSDYSGTFTKVNCASSDGTGSAGLINLASTELVDPGSGDYRTKSTSVLATAGTGGSFVGVALESSSGITLTVDSGAYTYTGTNAELIRAKILNADSGAYNYTGSSINLLKGSVLSADSGSYSYLGQDVTLIYTPAGSFVLSADSGVYAYTGQDINFNRDRVIIAGSGVYSYNGTDIQITLPGQIWTDKPSASTNWNDQTSVTTIWTDK